MASTAKNSETNLASTEMNLQLRYTELLEKRIAQLEAAIATPVVINVQEADAEESGDDAPDTKDGKATKKKDATASKDKDATKKSRYRNVLRKWDKKAGAYVDKDVGEDDQKVEEGEIAFTFKRKVLEDIQGRTFEAKSEVDIVAPGLRNLLKKTIGTNYPGQNLEGDNVNIIAPYAPLIHNWDELEKAVGPDPEDLKSKSEEQRDLYHLLERIRIAPELEKYFQMRESNIRANITSYETMWTLFAPRTKVLAKVFLKQPQIFEVAHPPIPRTVRMPRKLEVLVWCWDWNGKKFTKVFYNLPIDRFWDTKEIHQLSCYPLKFYKDGDEKEIAALCETLQNRGKIYDRVVRSAPGASQMYMYDGAVLSERRSVVQGQPRDSANDNGPEVGDDDINVTENRRKTVLVKGQFIVDPEAFLRFGTDSLVLGEHEPIWTGELYGTDSQEDESHGKSQGTEEMLMYPPRILGYSTKEKIWGQFSVESTSDAPEPSLSLFQEKLQLDENYKSMIQALVREHGAPLENKDGSENVKVEDVVKNKGKGLVLLLHGPPGVGKTLTAETIAEATGKPLFVVSVAEIGLDASKAERNLDQMFYLAAKWQAVLLVDEADVFLEARTSDSEPNRNALVSVLLRVLEYYDGIIILTTNRITSLDIAVQSRIHLAIRYEDLDKEQKINVFKMFLHQLEPESIKNVPQIFEFVEEYACRDKLNGRQIRNVVASALSLARNQAKDPKKDGDPRLTVQHLKDVLYITKDFQEQLESITTDQRRHNEAKGSRR